MFAYIYILDVDPLSGSLYFTPTTLLQSTSSINPDSWNTYPHRRINDCLRDRLPSPAFTRPGPSCQMKQNKTTKHQGSSKTYTVKPIITLRNPLQYHPPSNLIFSHLTISLDALAELWNLPFIRRILFVCGLNPRAFLALKAAPKTPETG